MAVSTPRKNGWQPNVIQQRRIQDLMDRVEIRCDGDKDRGIGKTWSAWLPEALTAGHLSVFEFDKEFIDSNVVDLEKRPSGLIEELIRPLINKPQSHNWLRGLSFVNQRDSSSGKLCDQNVDWNKFAEVLKPYGIIGYKHVGGNRVGNKNHQVYILWDETLVNSSRIQ